VETSRPTQKDIARKAGVTQATVSLALRNHPSIRPETAALIQSVADKLAYTPDPYLSGLSSYRSNKRAPVVNATLAWISNDTDGSSWKSSPVFSAYFAGARERAARLGYRLETHCLRQPGMTPARLERILLTRNISGILLAPQPRSESAIDFPFDNFSTVTFGYTLASPRLHLVTWHQFRAMETAFRKLLSLGYRRPGLAQALESDLRSDRNWSAAFLSEQLRLPASQRVPQLIDAHFDAASLVAWYHRHKPDVIVTIWSEALGWLREAGISVPGEVGLALLSIPDGDTTFSGLSEQPRIIGAKAVELVVDMIHRSERGIPDMQICMLTEGRWHDGATLRSPAVATA
jgi:DNA-binding LacI/PurR family transcriptional regulator